MNAGRSLQSLAAELTRQTETRKDYLAPQGKLEAVVVETGGENAKSVQLAGFNGDSLAITPHAHGQLAQHLGIPQAYYNTMATKQPELLAQNINTWMKADETNRRMIRTLDGKVRAVLSPKFRALDNFDLAQAVMPTLIEKKVQIVSCELTETRMYIKGILPELSDELPNGLAYGTGHNILSRADRGRVVSAIVISNSDIGAGTLRVEPSVFTTFCTNLAIMAEAAMKKYHAGRANQSDDTFSVLSDEARRADDAAFWLKVRDITMAAFDEKVFRAAVERMRATAGNPIKSDDLPAVVSMVVEQLALPQVTNHGILKALAAGGDLTQWGLSSAITRVAGDIGDYELATEMERAGGKVLALGERDWSKIAAAVAA